MKKGRRPVAWSLDLLFSRCEPEPNSGCWLWTGAACKLGYGSVRIASRTVATHRLSFALAHGHRPPQGMSVCHWCDTPACCNPSHLFAASQGDNIRDSFRKGRSHSPTAGITHCKHGHELTPGNFYPGTRNGYRTRTCRQCVRRRGTQHASDFQGGHRE